MRVGLPVHTYVTCTGHVPGPSATNFNLSSILENNQSRALLRVNFALFTRSKARDWLISSTLEKAKLVALGPGVVNFNQTCLDENAFRYCKHINNKT